MLQIAGFVLILVAVYAVKAVAVARTHSELAANSESFAWTRVRSEDAEVAAAARAATVRPRESSLSHVRMGTLRRAGGAHA